MCLIGSKDYFDTLWGSIPFSRFAIVTWKTQQISRIHVPHRVKSLFWSPMRKYSLLKICIVTWKKPQISRIHVHHRGKILFWYPMRIEEVFPSQDLVIYMCHKITLLYIKLYYKSLEYICLNVLTLCWEVFPA